MPSIRLPGRLRRVSRAIRKGLPERNFITLHYAYFIFMSLFTALIFWASATPLKSVSFTDSLFLCVSAITESGLNTINLSQINTFQQVILFLLMLTGSAVFVSAVIVFVRLRAFETAFADFKKERLSPKQEREQNSPSRHWLAPTRSSTNRSLRDTAAPEAHSMANIDLKDYRSNSADSPIEATRRMTHAESEMNGGHRRDQSNGSLSAAEQKNSDSDVAIERGRPMQTQIDRTQLQNPSKSPAGRESEHDDHTEEPTPQHVGFEEGTNFRRPQVSAPDKRPLHSPWVSFTGVGASSRTSIRVRSASTGQDGHRELSRTPTMRNGYDQSRGTAVTSEGWTSRNSQFHGLTMKERETLGGREYRCVFLLSVLVPFYIVIWQFLGAVSVGAWVNDNRPSTAYENGIKPWWVGAFMTVSAFNNNGMSLLDANMTAFQNSSFLLVSMSLFILAGNTAYPIFMRMAIWTMWKLVPADNPKWAEDKASLRFLLDHPRRVYTNLFPSRHTWWLAAVLIILNGIDWIFFEILSIGDKDIESLPAVTRVLGGLFQAFAVRSGGFYVVPIPTLRLSLQFLYTVMMYISVYPVTITMRTSNVYEERSLGIFAEDIETDSETDEPEQDLFPPAAGRMAGLRRRLTFFAHTAAPAPKRERASFFVRHQLHNQLAHDVWFLVLAIFFILIVENGQLEGDPADFSVFDVIFEVVSGYATVGLSVGVPDNAYSFSGSWHALSKLVLCAVMLRGRHRGLPVAIDHAIQLPGRTLWIAEDEDGERRMGRMERADSSLGRTSSATRGLNMSSPTGLLQGTSSARVRSNPSVA